jgi:predicted ATP-dependent serine protease
MHSGHLDCRRVPSARCANAARGDAHNQETDITTFLIGHVTKEGAIAGPRVLGIWWTPCCISKDQPRLPPTRAVKNRFGSTNEIGVFEMKESGLEKSNPLNCFWRNDPSGFPVPW